MMSNATYVERLTTYIEELPIDTKNDLRALVRGPDQLGSEHVVVAVKHRDVKRFGFPSLGKPGSNQNARPALGPLETCCGVVIKHPPGKILQIHPTIVERRDIHADHIIDGVLINQTG